MNFGTDIMVSRGWILITSVIPRLFLWRHKQVKGSLQYVDIWMNWHQVYGSHLKLTDFDFTSMRHHEVDIFGF